jgi:hypothetical protein
VVLWFDGVRAVGAGSRACGAWRAAGFSRVSSRLVPEAAAGHAPRTNRSPTHIPHQTGERAASCRCSSALRNFKQIKYRLRGDPFDAVIAYIASHSFKTSCPRVRGLPRDLFARPAENFNPGRHASQAPKSSLRGETVETVTFHIPPNPPTFSVYIAN